MATGFTTDTDKTLPINQPNPIISFSELVNTTDIIRSSENTDKAALETLINVNETDLRDRLVLWGVSGFSDAHILYSFQLNKLDICSDGKVRNDAMDYYNFLFPETRLTTVLSNLEQRLPGMKLSYSYTNNFTISIHISKL